MLLVQGKNIKVKEEVSVAKIEGVDGDETKEAEGRGAHDEQEDFGSKKMVRKHDPRQASEQERGQRLDHMLMGDEKEEKRLAFLQERGRREPCFARWFRGR